jgi:hypothetical protein
VNRGGRRGARDAGRWWLTSGTGVRRCPVVASGVLERAEKRGQVATGGPEQHSTGEVVQQYFEQIPNSNVSNKLQTVSNFGLLEKYFPGLREIEIKYGFEGLEEMNFFHRHFLRLGMDLELKFKEVSMS